MKVLVTGANGYLGQGIVASLLKKNFEIIATDIKIDRNLCNVEIKECDIFSIENPQEYFGYPDIMLHLAWRDGFVHYSGAHIDDLPKHYKFIKTMVDTGLRHVAVMGSMHEIGFWEGPIKEDTPCNPVTPYGIAKNALRELTKMLCTQNPEIVFQWLRGYYIVGDTGNGSSLFSKIAFQAKNTDDRDFPFTRGQNQYDFVDYDSFCEMVVACLNQKKINGIIELCSGKPEKLAERVERFISENNFNIKLKYGAFPDRPYDSLAVWGDATKIHEIMRGV